MGNIGAGNIDVVSSADLHIALGHVGVGPGCIGQNIGRDISEGDILAGGEDDTAIGGIDIDGINGIFLRRLRSRDAAVSGSDLYLQSGDVLIESHIVSGSDLHLLFRLQHAIDSHVLTALQSQRIALGGHIL